MSTQIYQLPWIKSDKKIKIAIVGDAILDEYLEGTVDRISPEAPVPVHLVKSCKLVAGGAANVARNVVKAGGECSLYSVVGQDDAYRQLKKILNDDGIETHGLVSVSDRPTIKKTRITANNQQLLRVDWERRYAINQEQQDILFDKISNDTFDCLLISDYGKGTLPKPFVQKLIKLANDRKCPCVIDPKGLDYDRYHGADLVKPNRKEAHEALGISLDINLSGAELGKLLQEKFSFKDVLVTLGADGMVLTPRDQGAAICKKTKAREVFDVSGAGDTVISIIALSVASHEPYENALELASLAAGVVIEKWGTQAIERKELEDALWISKHNTSEIKPSLNKIVSQEQLQQILKTSSLKNKVKVFTNGCFDLMHAGHVRYLEASRNLGDLLILGVNTDESIKRIKGENRPIVDLAQRMEVLAALSCVDFVVPFSEDTPAKLIESVIPNILVKGADYKEDDIVGAKFVKEHGGAVRTITLVPGISSSEIIRRARSLEKGEKI